MHKATARYFKGKDSFIFTHKARIGKIAKNAVAIFFDILKNMRYICDVLRLRLLNAGMVCVLTLLSYAHAKG